VTCLPVDALGGAGLDISGMTAALHVAAARATLELFAPGRQLLLVTTANRLEPSCVRGVCTTATAPRMLALVAVGTVEPDAPLPVIRFTHRRGQVRAWLTRLGLFWLAGAAGRRLPVSTHQSTGRLNTPFLPAQETS
jgi:hypothetical protein